MPGRLRGPNLQTTAGHCLLRFVISRRDLRRVWGQSPNSGRILGTVPKLSEIARGVNPWSSSSFGEEPLQGSDLLLHPTQGSRPGLFPVAPSELKSTIPITN